MKAKIHREKKYFVLILTLALLSASYSSAQNVKADQYEYRDNARVNTKTNITAAMYNVNSHIYAGTPEEIAKQYLSENKAQFGISDKSDLKFIETIESPAGMHVGFLQTYKGIPVFGSVSVVSINKENRVSMVVNGNTPITGIKGTTAGISKDVAIGKAIAKVNAEENTFLMKPKAELYIYRDSLETCTLTWKINFIAQKPQGDWQVFVDANTGEVLKVMNVVLSYISGSGRVFKPDPVTDLRSSGLKDQDNLDYPQLAGAYKIVTLNNLNDAVGGVYRLQGKYAKSDSIMAPGYPLAMSSTTSFLYDRSQFGFEETGAYYFLDLQRQYIGGLGFAPKWNGQDYIRFDAHGVNDIQSGYYDPGPKYILFSDLDVDDAEDQDVILHEYMHAIHDVTTPGGILYRSFDEGAVSEGSSDYMALSYRRTLSNFQQNHVFNWSGNGNGGAWPGRTLSPTSTYPTAWQDPDDHICGILWASTMMDIESSSGIGRDVTNRLLIASFSYVSSYSTVFDNVNAILQADRDIYGGAHLLTLFTVFNNRGLFYNQQVSGTISSNTTWSGNKVVTGNVTVTNGAILTISPNTFIFFVNGSSLIINNYGTLTACGSLSSPITFEFFSPNSSTQNGIIFNSSAMGTISFCKILKAYRGIYENGVSINITNSALSNCYNGLYLYNSAPTIRYCNFHDNINAGIYLNYSSPYLYNNYMRNNYYGVYCSTNSNPKFGNGSTQGKNDITNNYCGVYCWNNSYPVIGKSTPLDGGYNNLVNAANNIYNGSSGTVYANHIWWGTNSPANFKIMGSGTTSYTNYLSSSVTISPAPPLNKSDNIYASSDNDIPLLSELNKAYELIALNNLEGARKICFNLINNYPDYSVSYNALNLLAATYPTGEISSMKNSYKSLFNSQKKDIYAMAGLILADIDKTNRLNLIDNVINSYKCESIVELALFDKFVYYYFEKGDKQNAIAVSNELDKLFQLSIGAIEAHKILGDEEYFKIELIRKKDEQSSTDQIVTTYSLFDNYPNPFNPSTTLSFSIPSRVFVSLKIYDLLGREVASIVSEEMPAGKYSKQWNASNMASGIYFYRLQAGSFTDIKKLILLK